MNKKGQLEGLGVIIVTAFGLIVAMSILISGIAPIIGQTTQTFTLTNFTVTAPAAGGTLNLIGQAVQGSLFVANGTGGETVAATNYTITNYKLVSGQPTAQMNFTGTKYASQPLNISGTLEPFGYETTSAGRSMISLILVFVAVAIVAVALVPVLRNGVLDLMGK